MNLSLSSLRYSLNSLPHWHLYIRTLKTPYLQFLEGFATSVLHFGHFVMPNPLFYSELCLFIIWFIKVVAPQIRQIVSSEIECFHCYSACESISFEYFCNHASWGFSAQFWLWFSSFSPRSCTEVWSFAELGAKVF